MRRILPFIPVFAILLAGWFIFGRSGPGAVAQDATPAVSDPTAGERVHVDLAIHFPWDTAAIAHHWCKPVTTGVVECLIYAADDTDAPLVAVEEVVPEATYNGFDPAEQQLWHSNVAEAAAGSDPSQPAPSLAEAATAAAQSGGATYGKLILLWDLSGGDLPMDQPQIIYPQGTEPGTPTA